MQPRAHKHSSRIVSYIQRCKACCINGGGNSQEDCDGACGDERGIGGEGLHDGILGGWLSRGPGEKGVVPSHGCGTNGEGEGRGMSVCAAQKCLKLFPSSFKFVESFWALPQTPLNAAIETTRPGTSSTLFKGLIRPFDPAACIVHCLFPVSLVPTNTVCAFTIAGQEGKACCSPGEEGCIKI